jgi:hypothetical protein
MSANRVPFFTAFVAGLACALSPLAARAAEPAAVAINASPQFSAPIAFDSSPALRASASARLGIPSATSAAPMREIRPERGPIAPDKGHVGDGALQVDSSARSAERAGGALPATIQPPLANFEGLRNDDNFALFGGRVNPPDPVGDVGPDHYVEMVNIAVAVYDKQGNRLLGPVKVGDLWAGFAVADCAESSGDPIVLYDQTTDRWLLSQFTTRGPIFYNCVAISQTGDPRGAYYRYAFSAGLFFPDYPKYGVWRDSYLLTSRDFGPTDEYGISVYALEKSKMVAGDPNARSVKFFLDSALVPINLIGDGLLPADLDGKRRPERDAPAPIVGTQDDDGPYGATFDALNVFELDVKWRHTPAASLRLAAQVPVAPFDTAFPCAPDPRDCLPQPGIVNRAQYLDILSYRQRPTWRLAYRNFGDYEAMVTSQSVEARTGIAGMRWYEIRRDDDGAYKVHQQGTFAPQDGVHRWMGSVAMDARGNIALGYSVVNGVDVYPGIRYTGRLKRDPAGQMTLGEGTIVNGSGVQTTVNSRWGDYTSMNVDPSDDCTFWYVNEYYEVSGAPGNTAPWRTRIASFQVPGCTARPDDD